MATEFPTSEFIGVDLALLQKYVTAENCEFRIMNVLDGKYLFFDVWFGWRKHDPFAACNQST
jgi:hypothetical protein